MFTHQTGFWLRAATRNTAPGGGKGAAQRRPRTAAPFNFPHSRSFRWAGAAVVRSSAGLLLARDEKTPEATARGKRDRAGLLAAGPRSQPAGSLLDPKSRWLPKPGAPASNRNAPPTGRAASASPYCPRALPFPHPPRIPTGWARGFRLRGRSSALRDQPGTAPRATRLPAPSGPRDLEPESSGSASECVFVICVEGLHPF